MSNASSGEPVDINAEDRQGWNWTDTIQSAVRRVHECIAVTSQPWVPDNSCSVALGILLEALQHYRDTVLDSLLDVLKDMELPSTLNTIDARLRLYQVLCMTRVVSSCMFHEWLSYQREDITSTPYGAWRDPKRQRESTVRKTVATVAKHFERLLTYEHALISARANEPAHGANESDKSRPLSFLSRDSDSSMRDEECLYAMHDAHNGLNMTSASPDAYYVLDAHFPPTRAPIKMSASGVSYTATMWQTPADALDTPPLTLAASLYRELSYLMLYVSSSDWDLSFQRCESHPDSRVTIRLMECLHWRWPQLDRFLRAKHRDLPLLPRTLFSAYVVMIRRIVHKWALFHADERNAVCASEMPEAASLLFDGLYVLLDSPRRRVMIWPTLGVLVGLAPVAYAPTRMRRESHSKKWLYLDALYHHMSHPRLGPAAWFSTVLIHNLCALGKSASVPQAITSATSTRLCELLHLYRPEDARLAGLFLASLIVLGYTETAMDLIHSFLYARPSHAGVLVVAHALLKLLVRDLGAWRRKLYPPCAPVLRRTYRGIIRTWIATTKVDDMSIAVLHSILYLALLDPMAVLTLLPNESDAELRLPQTPTVAQLDAALQKDSRVSLILGFLHMPTTVVSLHAASLAALKRLSGGTPASAVLSRFPYVPSWVVEGPKAAFTDTSQILAILAPADLESARSASHHVLQAESEGSMLYWLVALHTALSRILRSHGSIKPTIGPTAVLYGLCMPNLSVVQQSLDVGIVLDQLADLPTPLPLLIKARPNLSLICQVLSAVEPPNAMVVTAWTGLMRVLQHILPRYSHGRVSKSELTHMAHVLVAGAHVALHDAPESSEMPLVRTVADLLLYYSTLHDLAFILLEAVPTPVLPHIVSIVHEGLPRDTASLAAWLRLLHDIVPRVNVATLPSTMLRQLVDMLLVCARSAESSGSRRNVCQVAGLLAQCERVEVDCARAELVDCILPWALSDEALRKETLECVAPLTTRLTDDIAPIVLRLDSSSQSALSRRTARIVDRLICAASLDKDMDAGVRDMALGHEPSLAVTALEHVLRQNMDFLAREAVTLTVSPLSSARIAIMLAVSRLFTLPEFAALDSAAEVPQFDIADALFAEDGRWIARCISSGAISDAQLLERVLAGMMRIDKIHKILLALLDMEIDTCTGNAQWLRTNSSTLAFLSAYARRSAYVHTQSVVHRLAGVVASLPPDALDWDAAQSEDAQSMRLNEAIRLILIASDELIEFIRMLPAELHWLCEQVYSAVQVRFGADLAAHSLGTFLCLRVLGPAIAAPETIAVTMPKGDAARRALLFLNKVLVALPQGRFPAHREGTFTALNDLMMERGQVLVHVLHESSRHGQQHAQQLDVTTRILPQPVLRPLRRLMEERALHGDANASTLLQLLPRSPSLHERIATALGGQSASTMLDFFLKTYSSGDLRGTSAIRTTICSDGRIILMLLYSKFDTVRADFVALAHMVLTTIVQFKRPWSMLLDLTGATERQLLQTQFIVFVATLIPAPIFRALQSIIVVHAGTVVKRHGWSINDEPFHNCFLIRRENEGGPPLTFTWVTYADDIKALHPDIRASLPPSTTRLFTLKPKYIHSNISIDDGFCTPMPATLTLFEDVIVVRNKPLTMSSHTASMRICDVMPLADIYIRSDHVSRLCIQRLSSDDVLYISTLDCAELEHQLYTRCMALGAYAVGLYTPVSQQRIRAVFVGMGLFYRTSSDMPTRFAADTMLRAAGVIQDEMQPVFIPPNMPDLSSLRIQELLRAGALRSALGIATCLGREHVLFGYVDQLISAVCDMHLPQILHTVLLLWMLHPELRTTLHSTLSVLHTLPYKATQAFLDVCIDLTPMSASPVLNSIQDTVLTAALPHLHDEIIAHLRNVLTCPRSPGLLHKMHALIALHSVQCLVPGTPVRKYMPDAMRIVLLFYQDVSMTFHTASYMTLFHVLAAWPAPSLAPLAREKLKPSMSLAALVELVNTIIFTLSTSVEECSHWTLTLERQIQAVAFASGSLMQSRALHVLGHLSNSSQAIMHSLGGVLMSSFPHVPSTSDAAAMCLSRVFLPQYAPILFWAGLVLITGGAYRGGLRLALAALDALGSDAFASIAQSHLQFPDDAAAFETALGISFERDFSFACASVLRKPLWDGDSGIQKESRMLIERLNAIVPNEANSGENKDASGLSLLLFFMNPSDTALSAHPLPPQYDHLKDKTRSNNRILSVALARSFLPHASDAQLQAMLPLLTEADPHAPSKAHGDVFHDASPLSQLGFSGLKREGGSGQMITECRTWLQHIVQQWA